MNNGSELRRAMHTHLMMPYFTTARTTAFIPALSPPDVSTAIFGFDFVVDIACNDEQSKGK